MHNLIKSRAVFEILKKPLPELLRFYRESESESDCEDSATEATRATQTETAAATTPTSENNADAEEAAATAAAKLNVNASVFVPRSKNDNGTGTGEEVRLSELKRHFEALDERKPAQPKMMLPWKGFPKPIQTERPSKARKYSELPHLCPPSAHPPPAAIAPTTDLKLAVSSDLDEPNSEMHPKRAQPLDKERKKPGKERASTKSAPPDEKRREQERKVALEALKLVQQRRMREPTDQPQIIVHLTRSPVDFSPEERVRVNRLRIIKREHIENVLREMRQELELKQQQAEGLQVTSRYICLQRTVKLDAEPELEPKQPAASGPPKRYIPTVKQWDERCKAKANQAAAGANKENNMAVKMLSTPEENAPPQRAMVPSSQANIIPPAVTSRKLQSQSQPERELFVPRYWPPAPLAGKGEQRRGNLTHARNITRAFANCGLLPTPPTAWDATLKQIYEMPREGKPVKRYGMEELLQLEPQPYALQKPHIDEALCKLGFICE